MIKAIPNKFTKRTTNILLALFIAFWQLAVPVLSSQSASADAAGNNGTFKVHEFGTTEGQAPVPGSESNDPKVCVFNFEAFDLDPSQTSDVTVETQSGTPITPLVVPLSTDASGYGQTGYINETGGTLTLADGHYKATLDNKFGTDPEDKAKSKVFWVNCATPDDDIDYCDPSKIKSGSVANWLSKNNIDGSDCFDYVETKACGSLDVQFTRNDTPYNYYFRYVKGTSTPTPANSSGDGVLPVNFAEDENDGSVTVTYYAVGPEGDYFSGFGIPNVWDGNGKTVTITTDCEQPPQIDPCDYAQLRAATGGTGNVAQRLQKLGVTGEECFEEVEVIKECSYLDVQVSHSVRDGKNAYTYAAYHNLTGIKADGTFPLTFPEDYNGGSVTVNWTIAGTENDYLALWDSNGSTEVDTDCHDSITPVDPVPPTTPTVPQVLGDVDVKESFVPQTLSTSTLANTGEKDAARGSVFAMTIAGAALATLFTRRKEAKE